MENKEVIVTDSSPLLHPENGFGERVKNSVVLKTITFGANGLFFAGHLVLNGKYLSYLGTSGPGASSIMSTYQSVVLGSGIGCLLGTGIDFGNALGQKKYREAGEIAKTATILSGVLGVICTGALCSSKGLLPLVIEKSVADLASDFFLGYSGAAPALLFLIMGPQIAFQEGDWYIPPACMLSVLSISGGASYLLGYHANMGALGIGLGGLIGSYSTAVGLALWFTRKNYHKYELFDLHITDFQLKLKSLLTSGWKLSLQRLSEWGNLLAITLISGAQHNYQLAALNPSLLSLVLVGTAQQGFAASAGMVIAKHNGEIKNALQELNRASLLENHKNNIRAIFKLNTVGVLVNCAIFTGCYFARSPISHFLLGDNASEETIALAETLLWVNMLGMIPDAVRIISAGALRGWKDFLYPTIMSLVLMTAIGVPTGFGFGQLTNDPTSMMIYFRCFTMLMSAFIVFKRCHTMIRNDESEILIPNQVQAPSFFGTGLSFFGRSNREITVIDDAENQINHDLNLNSSV